MIQLFHGANRDSVRVKASGAVTKLSDEKTEIYRFDADNVSLEALRELAESQSLFGGGVVVDCRFTLDNESFQKIFLENLNDFADSDQQFIFAEGELEKEVIDKFKKAGVTVTPVAGAASKPNQFNIFALCDALGEKDKKTLWVLYHKALMSGLEPEEVHSRLFWQVKTMLMAAVTKGDEKTLLALGQKPFTIQKSRRFLKSYKEGEVQKLSSKLVELYHESRRAGPPLEIALEQFILSL